MGRGEGDAAFASYVNSCDDVSFLKLVEFISYWYDNENSDKRVKLHRRDGVKGVVSLGWTDLKVYRAEVCELAL